MKMLVSALIVGALSTTGAFAGVAGSENAVATPHVPFRPLNKRPSGARQAVVVAPVRKIGAPQLPFRHYQKQPTAAPSNQPSALEATKQQ